MIKFGNHYFPVNKRTLNSGPLQHKRCNGVKNFSALTQAPNEQFKLINRTPIIINHAIRTMVIQTQETPNPNSLKFLPGIKILEPGETFYFPNVEAAHCSLLAKMLFSIEGVTRVLFESDFVTIIEKDENVDWMLVKPDVCILMDFFASGLPVVTDAEPSGNTQINEDDDKTVQMVKELHDTKIRVIMQEHGGDVQFVDFKDGVLRLKMQGSCSSCPNSVDTLKNGILYQHVICVMHSCYGRKTPVVEVLEDKQIHDGDKCNVKLFK